MVGGGQAPVPSVTLAGHALGRQRQVDIKATRPRPRPRRHVSRALPEIAVLPRQAARVMVVAASDTETSRQAPARRVDPASRPFP